MSVVDWLRTRSLVPDRLIHRGGRVRQYPQLITTRGTELADIHERYGGAKRDEGHPGWSFR